ncbi:MAG: DUF1116 domain-containing protein [Anaerolineales bacterium]|nr:DUF1116 domain-containing protein [Anaerolineales bacterium]
MDDMIKIEAANRQAMDALLSSKPVWIDVKPALDVLPGMTPNLILHAGPPIEWDRMCGPQQKGIINAAIYEKLAQTPGEALALIEAGKIRFAPCHDYNAVGGMAGITSPSMPMIVVLNENSGHMGYSQLYQGPGVQELRWGDYDTGARKQWQWLRDVLGPSLGAAIRRRGGMDVKTVIAKALQMGDECHNRNSAGSNLLLKEMMPWLLKSDLPEMMVRESVEYLCGADQFFLCVAMAAAKATMEAVKGVPYSTVVTALCRNGVDFGIKVSGLGEQWFTAPANKVNGLYFSSEWGDEDAVLDIGDSAIMETAGLGGHVQATAPALQQFVGGSFARAVELTREMRQITLGVIQDYQLPNLDFEGAPAGIDILQVIQTGITPIIDTAIAHKKGGVIGAGQTRAPLGCFERALVAFWETYSRSSSSSPGATSMGKAK